MICMMRIMLFVRHSWCCITDIVYKASSSESLKRSFFSEVAMRINEQKYILPDGREIVIKSAGPEDALKVKLHREATSAETHFMANYYLLALLKSKRAEQSIE